MIGLRRKIFLETERLTLRLPVHADFRQWATLRRGSADFLSQWEPSWADDHLSRKGFANRVYWSARSEAAGTALPFFLVRRSDNTLLGAVTLDNIRRGPAQSCTIGYWIGESFARRGYMREAVNAVCYYAFGDGNLSRIEAACLPENVASRGLLEKCGFKYEGVAQSYLQIAGRWRNHVLYAMLRNDRRGRTEVG